MNQRVTLLLLFGFFFGLSACDQPPSREGWQRTDAGGEQSQAFCGHEGTYLELATNYVQNAAEYRALCHQAYNLAEYRLKEIMENPPENPAVVLDIDETVLNNSPYQAQIALKGGSFPEGWVEWCNRAEAEPIAGVLEFCKKAKQMGATIFYVTNRKEPEFEGTLKNLQRLGFPFAEADHLMVRTETGDKTARRARVAENHEIVLLIGDNLGDFDERFQDKSVEERRNLVDARSAAFGDKFIVLPNPMYGEWYGALIDYDYSLPQAKQQQLRTRKLQGFRR